MKPTDSDLINREFSINDPQGLPNTLDYLPDTEEVPYIEFQYDLTSDDYRKTVLVKCVHCKKSAVNHSRGFVMRLKSTGERFLIGRNCGAKHYAADFQQVSRDFTAQKRRSGLLKRLAHISAISTEVVSVIDALPKSPLLRVYDELVIAVRDRFPDLRHKLSVAHGQLLIPEEVRDLDREIREGKRYDAEIADWKALTTTEQKKRRKEGYRVPVLQKRYKWEDSRIGYFFGRDFLADRDTLSNDITQSCTALLIALKDIDQLKTDEMSSNQLRKAIKCVTQPAQQIATNLDRLDPMKAFFSPANLSAIADWANRHPDLPEQYQAKSGLLISIDPRYSGYRHEVGLPSEIEELPDITPILSLFDSTTNQLLG